MNTWNAVEKIIPRNAKAIEHRDLRDEFQQVASLVQQSGNIQSYEAFQAYSKKMKKRAATDHRNLRKHMSIDRADLALKVITGLSIFMALASVVTALLYLVK